MNRYTVISPEMSVTIPVMDFGEGPQEYSRCVAEVEAPTKREAITAAVKTPDMKEWVEACRSDGKSPFPGLKATLEGEF